MKGQSYRSFVYFNAVPSEIKLCLWIIIMVVVASYEQTSSLSKTSYESVGTSVGVNQSLLSQIEYYVKKNDGVEMMCNVTMPSFENDTNKLSLVQSADLLKWYHNDQLISFGNRYTKDNDNSGKLIIRNVEPDDDGIWYCRHSRTGETGEHVNLTILEKPGIPYLLIDDRRLDVGDEIASVKENANLSVTCVVEIGNPEPKINWLLLPGYSEPVIDPDVLFIDSDVLYIGSDVPHIDPDVVSSDMNLNIVDNVTLSSSYSSPVAVGQVMLSPVLHLHHNSTIFCIVDHVTLQAPLNASILLNVEYSPKIYIKRLSPPGFMLREGDQILLKCTIDSNPPAYPVWKRDNQPPPVQQTMDGFLNFSYAQPDHSGWYKCTTKYSDKEYSSLSFSIVISENDDDTFSEEFDVSMKGTSIDISPGGEIKYECSVNSTSCWNRHSSEEPNSVQLDAIVYEQDDLHKCYPEERNFHLDKWKTRLLEINAANITKVYLAENNTVDIFNGDRASISMTFCGDTIIEKLFRIRDWQQFYLGPLTNRIDNDVNNCKKTEFIIPTVTFSHAGEYLLIIWSKNGISGTNFILNVIPSNDTTVVKKSDEFNYTIVANDVSLSSSNGFTGAPFLLLMTVQILMIMY